MSKIQPVITRSEKDRPERENVRRALSVQRDNGNGTKILGKGDISKKKEQRKNHVWLWGRMHIEERLNEGPRGFSGNIETKTKQYKTNITSETESRDSVVHRFSR